MTACPRCGDTIHPTHAEGRFQATGPTGYRANHPGAPLRRTRAGAEEDQCAWQAARVPLVGQEPLL